MEIQEKVNFLIQQAKEYEEYFQDESKLYEAVNQLDQKIIDELLEGYEGNTPGNQISRIMPVNFVREKILKCLKSGMKIDADLITEIKEKFISKDLSYFSDQSKEVLKGIQDYRIGQLGPFHAWRNNFRILYTFFFRSSIKKIVNNYLEDIKNYTLKLVNLSDFKTHYVNFDGTQNFGATRCWMALFPRYKVSHTNAYQLFFMIQHDGIHYGILAGSEIKRKIEKKKEYEIEELAQSEIFEDVTNDFLSRKNEIIKLNEQIKQVWKFAPGERAKYWDEFKKLGIMAIGWDMLGDLNNYPASDDIAGALGVNISSNQTWNIDLFRNASKGDIVIANRGRSEAVGIGIISGDYEYRKERKSFKHVRKVNWIIKKIVKFEKALFRADTFSPTLKYAQITKAYLKKYPELKQKFEKLKEGIIQSLVSEDSSDEKSYYWLNANSKIWNYMDYKVGETQTYTSKNSKGNKRRIYQYFLDVNPGDAMIGYLTSPYKQIIAMLEVTKSLFQDDLERKEVIEFTITEFLENPVDFSVVKSNPDLKNAEPIINNQGSLFKLREEEFEIIQNIIEDLNPPPVVGEDYPIAEARKDSGLNQSSFEEITNTLKNKKQIVIQGAPGTGKTYLAKIIAKYLVQDKDNYDIIQFHPSYSYEDFVEGYRPSEEGNLVLKSGIFKELCRKATVNPNKNYVLIIDEINRGSISKIFGELLYLLEYRDEKIKLTYTPEIEFQIPENLFLIGTMNLADRSLALIDYALRRRFCFITLQPDYNLIKRLNIDSELDVTTIIENIKTINQKIAANTSLGKDFEIGHSYFLKTLHNKTAMESVWRYEVEPLLLEYFFDNKEEVNNLKSIFFKNVEN